MKKGLSAILALLILAGMLASCGADASGEKDTDTSGTESSDDGTTTAAEPGYEFTKDYDGKTFRILNYEDVFSMHAKISPESEDGDILNDTQYKCVLTLEEKTGVTVEETNRSYDGYGADVRTMLSAGEDAYDVIYVNMNDMYPLASEGLLTNLNDNGKISLDADWWLHENNDLCVLNGKLWSAEGYAQLMVVDSTNILLFNEDIASELMLDMPYQTVSEGKWTLDVFAEYMKAGASINLGTDTPDEQNRWNLDQPGNGAALSGMLVSSGESMIGIIDGKLAWTAGSERFYNVCDKLAKIMSDNKNAMYYKEPSGVAKRFTVDQAMFSYGEIANTQTLRSVDFSFGVIPNPKYDESQSRYYSRKSWPSCGVSIPVTAPDAEMSGALADALNYLSKEMVWPVYRGLVLEQKNLRNEESIEMLDIILNSGMPGISTIYNVGTGVIDGIGEKLMKGDTNITSTVASKTSSVEKEIAKVNENM